MYQSYLKRKSNVIPLELLTLLQNSYTALWRYMYNMYQLDAFTQSCPADQDIINHYKLQQVSAHFHANCYKNEILPNMSFKEYFSTKNDQKIHLKNIFSTKMIKIFT